MAVQRKTKNLGFNRSKNREEIFKYIEDVLGIKEKKCFMAKEGFAHQGPNPVPIRNFNLLGVSGLQSSCKVCEVRYRAGRTIRNRTKFGKMTHKEICADYRKNYGELKFCTPCQKHKKPEDFPISIGMETGLHNSCKECAKSYTEATGSRWEILSPDGHTPLKINKGDLCQIKGCGSKEKLAKDHIFPLAKGGTDNPENLQVLCEHHNSSKSDTIISPIIKEVNDIKDKMICERYRNLLHQAKKEGWSLEKFEIEISNAVRQFIFNKSIMSDEELADFFEKEKQRNNRKHGITHAVKKFRQYCKKVILEPDKLISKSN